APAVKVAGVHLQGTRHFGDTLSAVETVHGRLLELFGEFSSRLHCPICLFRCFLEVNRLSQKWGPLQELPISVQRSPGPSILSAAPPNRNSLPAARVLDRHVRSLQVGAGSIVNACLTSLCPPERLLIRLSDQVLATQTAASCYSHRRALIGSMRVARRAGRYPATKATKIISTIASTIV